MLFSFPSGIDVGKLKINILILIITINANFEEKKMKNKYCKELEKTRYETNRKVWDTDIRHTEKKWVLKTE